jgi:tetratricopeptide (TPR) repeat protein
MKTLSFITVLLLCVSLGAYAQKSKVTTAESLLSQRKFEKAKEVIDEAIKHENCINYAKAHLVRGRIYQEIFEQDSVLRGQIPDLLDVVWDEYQTAIRLDEKKRLEKDLKMLFHFLSIDFINQGVNCYNTDRFEKALESFKRSMEVHASPYGSQKTDTLIIYYSGITAHKLERWDEAIAYFKKSLELNHEPVNSNAMITSILLQQSRSALAAGDTLLAKAKQEEGFQYLIEGHKKSPTNESILVELINYYLLGDQPEKAEPYLDEAIALFPEKAEYYRVRGILYEKLQQIDKAEAMYIKTLELDPTDFVAQYSYANIQLERVNEENKKLDEIEDNKLYNAAVNKIMQKYEGVLPHFEHALELKPMDASTLSTLSRIYFILRTRPNTGPMYQKKYEEAQELLKKQ